MASYYLTKLGRNRLTQAVEAYGPIRNLSLTKRRALLVREMKQTTSGSISLSSLIRMEAHHENFLLRTIEELFRFLNLSSDVLGDGLAYLKDEITMEKAMWRDLNWIAASENRYFGSDEEKQLTLLQNWYLWNNAGFWIFRQEQERIGSIVLLPIKPPACRQLQKGEITESDLQARDVFKPTEKERVETLYVESVIFHTVFDNQLRLAEEKICQDMRKLLRHSCNLDNLREIYALRASTHGFNLMKNLGFTPCADQLDPRKDNRQMYCVEAPEFLQNVDNRMMRLVYVFERYWR